MKCLQCIINFILFLIKYIKCIQILHYEVNILISSVRSDPMSKLTGH
jgi:hypothetical protein